MKVEWVIGLLLLAGVHWCDGEKSVDVSCVSVFQSVDDRGVVKFLGGYFAEQWPDVALLFDDADCPFQLVVGVNASLAAEGDERWTEAYVLGVQHWAASGRTRVEIGGASARAVLFGLGELVRRRWLGTGRGLSFVLGDGDGRVSVPEYRLRGQRIGYNNLGNSYDAWTVAQMDTYIRQLLTFGANLIEIVNPDGQWSPHFTLPPQQMNEAIAQLCVDYHMNVSLYYAPDTTGQWGSAWANLSRLDRLLVPAGDSGGQPMSPAELLAFVGRYVPALWAAHPGCSVWLTDQEWNATQMDEFYAIVGDGRRRPSWLSGVVYGPHTRQSAAQSRRRLPGDVPLAGYPDVAHQLKAQFAQPQWSQVFAFTLARESINPRPAQMRQIFADTQPWLATGFATYSEGVTADVNMMLWSYLGWDAARTVDAFLADYAAAFAPPGSDQLYRRTFASVVRQLELHWHGDVEHNPLIAKTYAMAQALRRNTAQRPLATNWRLQSLLFRAAYDLYEQLRAVDEAAAQAAAMQALADAPALGGALPAIALATRLLTAGNNSAALASLRADIFALGQQLYESIGLQTSVPLYGAAGIGRGACLDTIDVPLFNSRYLLATLPAVAALPDEQQRLAAVAALASWSDPGPGGFYDNPGDVQQQPHLVLGTGAAADPSFYTSALAAFEEPFNVSTVPVMPSTWYDWADSFYNQPLRMFYPDLAANATYQVDVVYPTLDQMAPIRLVAHAADGAPYLVHDYLVRPSPPRVLSFPLPARLTAAGSLLLAWDDLPIGQGGNGRGTQVAEIWLRVIG